ncbi:MAG: DUF1015 domain-containing protein [Actinomycetota bacterium]|nr:DUF1015 domain-containing protein [Actinomycetota bacterium]
MAEVRPFRGIRYNPEAVGDLSLVVAPPYDIIGEEERNFYYNRHPYNVIRLILNRPRKDDENSDMPHERAAQFFRRWLDTRVLIQDSIPGMYIYRQRYIIESEYKECTGIVARVRMEDFSNFSILPHEEIMPKPLEDRMKLLDRTGGSFDLIHTLYSDSKEKLKDVIFPEMERFPVAQFQTSDGIAHDIWFVTDEKFTSHVERFFSKKRLYIADGHHRYQSALEYSKKSGTFGTEDARNYISMMLVEMENPGLSLLPVHRVISKKDLPDDDSLITSLENWFDVSQIDVPPGSRSGQVYRLLKVLRKTGKDSSAFGVYLGETEKFLLMVLNPEHEVSGMMGLDCSQAYRNLDVTILHKLAIECLLGISSDREAVEKNIVFTKDPLEAVNLVDSGLARMAFFVNPVKVEQVCEVADNGERMPQKSTYFYPKPFSGVIMSLISEW